MSKKITIILSDVYMKKVGTTLAASVIAAFFLFLSGQAQALSGMEPAADLNQPQASNKIIFLPFVFQSLDKSYWGIQKGGYDSLDAYTYKSNPSGWTLYGSASITSKNASTGEIYAVKFTSEYYSATPVLYFPDSDTGTCPANYKCYEGFQGRTTEESFIVAVGQFTVASGETLTIPTVVGTRIKMVIFADDATGIPVAIGTPASERIMQGIQSYAIRYASSSNNGF